MKLKPINQQVVVVMGASSGIGRATALHFAERGASVVVAARNQKGLDAVVHEIQRKGGKAVAVVADTAHADQVQKVAERAIQEYGRIDTWAHVSGVAIWSPVEMTTPAEYARLVEINLLGQIYGALAALPHLRAQGRGALIHVSSIEGLVSFPFSGAYAASKHGVNGFLDSLRLELEREGMPIAVVNIMPAAIDTPIFENAITRLGVQPRGAPPVYAPEIVARTIVRAAQRPMSNIMVGGGGALLARMARMAPRLTHALLLSPLGFEAQLTKIRKSGDAPNNLFAPTPDQHLRIHGSLHNEELRRSLYTRIATSVPAMMATTVMAPVRNLVSRAIAAAYGLRYRKLLRGVKRGGAGAGLPDVVVQAIERAGMAQPVLPARETTQGVKIEQGVKLDQGVKIEAGLKIEKAQGVKRQRRR